MFLSLVNRYHFVPLCSTIHSSSERQQLFLPLGSVCRASTKEEEEKYPIFKTIAFHAYIHSVFTWKAIIKNNNKYGCGSNEYVCIHTNKHMRSTASYMLENVSLSSPIQWLNSLANYNSLTAAARRPFATAKCIYFHYEFPWREKIIIMCISNKPEWGKKCTLPFIVFRVGCLIASRWLAWHTFGLVWFTWYANMTTFTKHKHSLIHSVIKSWLFSTFSLYMAGGFLCFRHWEYKVRFILCYLLLKHLSCTFFHGNIRWWRSSSSPPAQTVVTLHTLPHHFASMCVLFLGQKETGGTNFLH